MVGLSVVLSVWESVQLGGWVIGEVTSQAVSEKVSSVGQVACQSVDYSVFKSDGAYERQFVQAGRRQIS